MSYDNEQTWDKVSTRVEADSDKETGRFMTIILVIIKLILCSLYIVCAMFANIGIAFIYVPIFLALVIYDRIRISKGY